MTSVQGYNALKTDIINNYPNMKKILGGVKDVHWGEVGDSTDEENVATEIRMGKHIFKMGAGIGQRNTYKKLLITDIIESDPAFNVPGFDISKFWRGFIGTTTLQGVRSEQTEKDVQYYTKWLAKAGDQWEAAELP